MDNLTGSLLEKWCMREPLAEQGQYLFLLWGISLGAQPILLMMATQIQAKTPTEDLSLVLRSS